MSRIATSSALILVAGRASLAAHAGETLHLVERATGEQVVDLGAKGDSPGDLLVFSNPLYDAANAKATGSSNGYCVRTVVGKTWQCSWTMQVEGGQLAVAGTDPDHGDADFAIVGGTGRYAGARGSLKVHARDAGNTAYDFTVSLR